MKHLLLKSIAGMLFLAVVMGTMLFLPAMSFNYPLTWMYLGAFFLPVVVITVYVFIYDKPLLKSRLSAGPSAEQRKSQKIIQSLSSLGFISTYIIAGFDHTYQWSQVPQWLSLVAMAMVVASFIVIFFVFRQNSFLSATIQVQNNQTVVTSGLYGLVRHPMYGAVFFLFIFTPLALGSYWAFISSGLLIIGVVLRAMDEEKELKENLAGYVDYCKKIKYRFIPYLF